MHKNPPYTEVAEAPFLSEPLPVRADASGLIRLASVRVSTGLLALDPIDPNHSDFPDAPPIDATIAPTFNLRIPGT